MKELSRMIPKPPGENSVIFLYIVFMLINIFFGVLDFFLDSVKIPSEYHHLIHHSLEFVYLAFALLSGTYMWFIYRQNLHLLKKSEKNVMDMQEERDNWKTRHEEIITGMHTAITRQLQNWGLSESEVTIALLLMRGFSHKQIAGLLDKSEKTVRNQSLSIYKKTGMTGRNELTAFFIEDIFRFEDLG